MSYFTITYWLEELKVWGEALMYLAAAVFLTVGIYQEAHLPTFIGQAVTSRVDTVGANLNTRLDKVSARLDERDKQIGATLESVKKTAGDVSKFVSDTYDDNYANVETTTVILRDIAEITHTVNTQTLPQVSRTLTMLADIKKDVDELSKATNTDLKSLNAAINNAATLLETLDGAVKKNSPEVEKLFADATKAVDNVNTLITDPHLKETLEHVDGVSDSTDKIFKRLASKVGVLKTVLGVLQNLAKSFLLSRPF